MKKLLIPFFVFILSFVIITPVAGQSGDYIHFTDNPLRYSNTVITIKNLPVADDYLLTWDNNGETNITYNFEPVDINIYVANFVDLEEVVFVLWLGSDELQTRSLPVSLEPIENEPTSPKINFDFVGDFIDLAIEFWYVIIGLLFALALFWFVRRGH